VFLGGFGADLSCSSASGAFRGGRGVGGRPGRPGPGVGPANRRRRARTPDGPAVAAAAPGASAPPENDQKCKARETGHGAKNAEGRDALDDRRAATRAANFLREEQMEAKNAVSAGKLLRQQEDQAESRKKVHMERGAARLEREAVAVERAEAANESIIDEGGGGAAPARAKGAAGGAPPSAKAENASPAPGCARACWASARPTRTCWWCWRRSSPTRRATRRPVGAELRRLLHRAQRKGRSTPARTTPRRHAASHPTSAAPALAGLRAAKGGLAPDADPRTAAVDAFALTDAARDEFRMMMMNRLAPAPAPTLRPQQQCVFFSVFVYIYLARLLWCVCRVWQTTVWRVRLIVVGTCGVYIIAVVIVVIVIVIL
jgi:hypothetical protein